MQNRKMYELKCIIQMVLNEGITDYAKLSDELGITRRALSRRIMKDMREMYPNYFVKVLNKLNSASNTHHNVVF